MPFNERIKRKMYKNKNTLQTNKNIQDMPQKPNRLNSDIKTDLNWFRKCLMVLLLYFWPKPPKK